MTMSLINQLNELYKRIGDGKLKLTTTQLALYMALLHINNRLFWKEQFGVTMPELKKIMGISKTETIITARKELMKKGLITFEQSCGREATKYRIKKLYKEPSENSGNNIIKFRLENS